MKHVFHGISILWKDSNSSLTRNLFYMYEYSTELVYKRNNVTSSFNSFPEVIMLYRTIVKNRRHHCSTFSSFKVSCLIKFLLTDTLRSYKVGEIFAERHWSSIVLYSKGLFYKEHWTFMFSNNICNMFFPFCSFQHFFHLALIISQM